MNGRRHKDKMLSHFLRSSFISLMFSSPSLSLPLAEIWSGDLSWNQPIPTLLDVGLSADPKEIV